MQLIVAVACAAGALAATPARPGNAAAPVERCAVAQADAAPEGAGRAEPLTPAPAAALIETEGAPGLAQPGAPPPGDAAAEEEGAAAQRWVLAEASIGGSSRGEERLEIIAGATRGEATVRIGAERLQGATGPPRLGVVAAAELSLEPLALHGELRALTPQAGVSRVAAELGLRCDGERGSIDLRAAARTTAWQKASLRAAGAALDVEAQLAPPLRLALHGAAWAVDLDGVRGKDAWSRFGASTLDWAERWDASVALRATAGRISLAPQLVVAGPAQDGALEAGAGARLEADLGLATLSAEAGTTYLSPQALWIYAAALGLACKL